jgi:hypothetical protein
MKQLTDRRQRIEAQIAFYQTQARLARMGFNTRRSAEFFERQISYLQEFGR